MKLVHKSSEPAIDALQKARDHESDGELKEAAGYYEKAVKVYSTDEKIYNRLMIIYRKLREYKKELAVINAGIKAFSDLYSSGKSSDKKVASISRALLKSTGLADKKGNVLFEQEPIGRWKKRKTLVEGKIKKSS